MTEADPEQLVDEPTARRRRALQQAIEQIRRESARARARTVWLYQGALPPVEEDLPGSAGVECAEQVRRLLREADQLRVAHFCPPELCGAEIRAQATSARWGWWRRLWRWW